jgi:hypothetical protein
MTYRKFRDRPNSHVVTEFRRGVIGLGWLVQRDMFQVAFVEDLQSE